MKNGRNQFLTGASIIHKIVLLSICRDNAGGVNYFRLIISRLAAEATDEGALAMSHDPANIGALWVWPAEGRSVFNQYVEFRHDFDLPVVNGDADLVISTDTNYAVWLNGVFVDCGQFSDYPARKTFDKLAVRTHLRKGRNQLAILVYYQGLNTATYCQGAPGLIYALLTPGVQIKSGPDTRCRLSPAYRSGDMPLLTQQTGFTCAFDARGDDGWRSGQYAPGLAWQWPAEVIERRATQLRLRPLPKLVLGKRLPVRIAAQGICLRTGKRDLPVAELMQADYLSARTPHAMGWGAAPIKLPLASGLRIAPDYDRPGEGVYLVLDLGQEQAGLLTLDLEAAAGTTIDIAYGEHLEDLRVRAAVGRRHFAHRYICRAGRQEFTHYFLRCAGRYFQIHIYDLPIPMTLFYAGLQPCSYPVRPGATFETSDRLVNRVYAVGRHTLDLCRHEHFEDCPWREQALYANDSRNQALSGYYCFDDYAFVRESLLLLGAGLQTDGWLELCAPARLTPTIPSFTLMWVLEVRDYWLYSGDRAGLQALYPTVRQILMSAVRRLRDGLLPCPTGRQYWHFYDWAPGLHGTPEQPHNNPSWYFILPDNTIRFDAPLNALLILALDAAAELARPMNEPDNAARFEQAAQGMRKAAHQAFWDAPESAYRTACGPAGVDRHFAELTQALAIMAGVCDAERSAGLRKRLVASRNGMAPTTLSQSFYKFQALLSDRATYGAWVFDRLAEEWGAMLFQGATTFWETARGAADFDDAGSLCHGWSAIPIYFYHAFFLGVQPLEPGFKRFAVDPWFPIPVRVHSQIPTPQGWIQLDLECAGGKVRGRVVCPQASEPVIALSAEIIIVKESSCVP